MQLEMSKFTAECPVDGCDFQAKSHWKKTTRGGVISHIYRTEGGGHGAGGSRLETDFEIRIKRVDEE
ncbi:hypothetical protein AKJ36_02560 [candidate division MSBL1 archaeon SCGC-AAA259I07]|uniref:Uncharacterized protein n=1 Tax=candidate division MSBL1 archaeon SCGC-AAA259I07 TaxID=1698266 RepID=A0A133UK77_9EURY|nr:hypothetical protein AKJ36_02560 [candidate division MSBL1 archaeon SCGC-AAA259I07]